MPRWRGLSRCMRRCANAHRRGLSKDLKYRERNRGNWGHPKPRHGLRPCTPVGDYGSIGDTPNPRQRRLATVSEAGLFHGEGFALAVEVGVDHLADEEDVVAHGVLVDDAAFERAECFI